MKNKNRMIRINDEIKRELSEIIRSELKDPRISVITSVLKVDTSNDLKYCKVYISVLGNEKEKEDVMLALKNASGFIRKQIALKINLRNTPEFNFKLDNSLEDSFKIFKIIDEINKGEQNV